MFTLYVKVYSIKCAFAFYVYSVTSFFEHYMNPAHGEVYLILHHAIISANTTDHHDITEILLIVALNTITSSYCGSNITKEMYLATTGLHPTRSKGP